MQLEIGGLFRRYGYSSVHSYATLIDRDNNNRTVGEFPSLASAFIGRVILAEVLDRVSVLDREFSAAQLDQTLRRVCERDYGTDDYSNVGPTLQRPLVDAVFLELQINKGVKMSGLRLSSSDSRCSWKEPFAVINRDDNELVASFKSRDAAAKAKSIIEACWLFDRRRTATEVDCVARQVCKREHGTADYPSIAAWKTPLLIETVGHKLQDGSRLQCRR